MVILTDNEIPPFFLSKKKKEYEKMQGLKISPAFLFYLKSLGLRYQLVLFHFL